MLEEFLRGHPALSELPNTCSRKDRRFAIKLSSLPAGREIQGAVLVVPNSFPIGRLEVRVSTKHILRIPHVESDGKICFPGDVGPSAGLTPEQRIDDTLRAFFLGYVKPWALGELDDDFRREAKTYWAIFAENRSSNVDTVRAVYTTDASPDGPTLLDAVLALPVGWIIAGSDAAFVTRFLSSLGPRAKQIANAAVLRVPIASDLIPTTWMTSHTEVEQFIASRVPAAMVGRFTKHRGDKKTHRVVIFSSPTCDYAYLLPGGPTNVKTTGKRTHSIPVTGVVPLNVHRIDAHWTYGRCQHPEVAARQNKRVVVFGAGALGAHIIDQLAKAGVGQITVVDPDFMKSANIGRHLLGADALGRTKAECVVHQVGRANPACLLVEESVTAEAWLQRPWNNKEGGVDMFVDTTGEPSVRASVESARQAHSVALLIGWMEPFVAAAHVCQLTAATSWFSGRPDRLNSLQAVNWPPEVMLREPACNSEFQAYTSAAAAHAVALVAEAAIELLDGNVIVPTVKSWVRGQRYLDAHHNGLVHRDWAVQAAPFDGLVIERPF